MATRLPQDRIKVLRHVFLTAQVVKILQLENKITVVEKKLNNFTSFNSVREQLFTCGVMKMSRLLEFSSCKFIS